MEAYKLGAYAFSYAHTDCHKHKQRHKYKQTYPYRYGITKLHIMRHVYEKIMQPLKQLTGPCAFTAASALLAGC